MALLKAKYKTVGPKREEVTYQKYSMVESNGKKMLQAESVTEEKDCYYVYFPQGHSIRITDKAELIRMGYHLKPRIIDMETGDVVDRGGDPYDFGTDDHVDVIVEDLAESKPSRSK
jgi:hypothetical protein